MFIVESKLRSIVRNELKKVLFEQDIAPVDSETGVINVELPQDEEQTKITMSAEQIAQIASEIADTDNEIEIEPQQINTYLSERKIK